jgi:hypothetical protein
MLHPQLRTVRFDLLLFGPQHSAQVDRKVGSRQRKELMEELRGAVWTRVLRLVCTMVRLVWRRRCQRDFSGRVTSVHTSL